jgi:hypothetical protein
MLNAIKEQQEIIRKQEAQIADLSSQVRVIRASLKAKRRSGAAVGKAKVEGAATRKGAIASGGKSAGR